jgi:hypothetical protein
MSWQRTPYREVEMKLPLIAASVVAYTVLAMAWICYAELTLP